MRRNGNNPARDFLKGLCAFLGVILVFLLAMTMGAQAAAGQLPRPEALLSLLSQGGENLRQGTSELLQKGEEAKNINILLVGQDKREGEQGNRSDSMILCTFNPRAGKLYMTSFLRDLYLPIPGHGSNRINAAYAFGGVGLLERTLEENFGVKIDGCVEVDFSQFAKIIDTLGGVTIELRQDETEVINRETGSSLQAGSQRLNGEQALAYSRIRKLDRDGDFSRTARQRKVLQQVWMTYRSSGVMTLVKTIGTLMPMLETDMGGGKLIGYALAVAPHLSDVDIVSQSIPEKGQYTDRMIDGMAVLVPDMDAARETIKSVMSDGE